MKANDGYYYWEPYLKAKGMMPLDQKRIVKVSNEYLTIFGSIKRWSIYEAQVKYGLLGPKISKLLNN